MDKTVSNRYLIFLIEKLGHMAHKEIAQRALPASGVWGEHTIVIKVFDT